MADSDLRIGFLGAGRMATVLARGWQHAGLASSERMLASDPVPQARAQFAQETGTSSQEDNIRVVERSDVLVLAVKPQNMAALLTEIAPAVTPRHLVISIAAGVTLAQLASRLGPDRRLIRVMPNAPARLSISRKSYWTRSPA
jgi:pyrroline-5-carboxylate reductase